VNRILRVWKLGKSLSDVLVKDVMTESIISVDPQTTVFQIAKYDSHQRILAFIDFG